MKKLILKYFFCILISSLASITLAQLPGVDNSRPDDVGTGPYPAMKEEVPSLPGHVIYRPRNLDALGSLKLGVVAWGNGGCWDDGAFNRFHLLEIASHGYLVIANGHIYSGPDAKLQPSGPLLPAGMLPPQSTNASELIDAIDWAIQENQSSDSPYFELIDPNQIAVSGHSCGGVQAMTVAPDPRIKTWLIHNAGVPGDEYQFYDQYPDMALGKENLSKIHGPIIFILGGETDIAYRGAYDTYDYIENIPVAIASLVAAEHMGTFMEPNGGEIAQVAVHWLQWQLRGQQQDSQYFLGVNCKLCTDRAWDYKSKGVE